MSTSVMQVRVDDDLRAKAAKNQKTINNISLILYIKALL